MLLLCVLVSVVRVLVFAIVVGSVGMIDVGHDGTVCLDMVVVVVVVVVVAVYRIVKRAGVLGVMSRTSICLKARGMLLVVDGFRGVLRVGGVGIVLLVLLLLGSLVRGVVWGALVRPWLMTLCGPNV